MVAGSGLGRPRKVGKRMEKKAKKGKIDVFGNIGTKVRVCFAQMKRVGCVLWVMLLLCFMIWEYKSIKV